MFVESHCVQSTVCPTHAKPAHYFSPWPICTPACLQPYPLPCNPHTLPPLSRHNPYSSKLAHLILVVGKGFDSHVDQTSQCCVLALKQFGDSEEHHRALFAGELIA